MHALETLPIHCPYCGESISIVVDCSTLSADDYEEYIEDCQVCCRPMQLQLSMDEDGMPVVSASHENDT